ncbi:MULTISPECIES: tRNA 2-thiouridine(34) synthase MnmA [Arcicella]|uniref:tRNA-specific 2-thiouridylase MnmA n=1 Tax=Arcicella aquatica TaxID=217141 RepID=A0ABU5QUW7_9BACT|nr:MULTISPECIES: tRNA 2-thiouridine(34) synthase MnmA [Arcicella]MDR6564617.1 tRNA-specific 2-thiouridylase [Arcicella sp. BE51]MDR6814455.1 tRNA-specific 2-thiouridylase [Arcicella sp. BE140]MDR6825789.1 tRNA-specific 2-thiouridylase [Arcicella sp. BE139]MEA5260500.1 tRNA 2-thiouridine(34) synthase MnmA [Arcicella aquatica]
MSKHGRILVAMSGGIDSSVAAVMLHEEGYEVVGMTMKTWDYASSGGTKKETGCCSLDSINDARNVAVSLGFPHYILDIRNEFGDAVIDYFTGEYIEGRTPNPCVMCNTHIKWDALLRRADKLDCEFIATGHYANIREENGRHIISKGADTWKDQSYVLWGVSQESLARTKLPLGHLTKARIREMATERGFMDLVNKSESYEICFVPDNDYRGFIKRRVEGLEERVKGGNFLDTDGKILGKHEGYPFYTIGQRKGLGIALGYPAFVTEIRKETNEVVLGRDKDLERDGMVVGQLNLSKYASIDNPIETITKVRYKDAGTPATIWQEGNKIKAHFHDAVSGIAPGQAAVFYEGDDVVGGGWIMKSFKQDATSGIFMAEVN